MAKTYPVQSVQDFVAESDAAVLKLAALFNAQHFVSFGADMAVVVSTAEAKSPETLKDDVEAIRATMTGREVKAQHAVNDALSYTSAKNGDPSLARSLLVDAPRVNRMFNAVANALNLWGKSTETLITVGKKAATGYSPIGNQISV